MSGYVMPQIGQDNTIFTEVKDLLSHKTEIYDEIPKFFEHMEELLAWVEENGYSQVSGTDRYYFYQMINKISKLLYEYKYNGFNKDRLDSAKRLLESISACRKYTDSGNSKGRYMPTNRPSFMVKWSLTRSIRDTMNRIASKMANDFLQSKRDFIVFTFPIIRRQAQVEMGYARYIAVKYELERAEVAVLLDVKDADPRVNKVLVPDVALVKKIVLPEKDKEFEEMGMFGDNVVET